MENRKVIVGASAAALVIIVAILLVVLRKPEPEIAPAPVVVAPPPPVALVAVEPEPEPEPFVVEEPDLPAAPRIIEAPADLDASDETARQAGSDLSLALGRMLMPSEQIRKWVVLIDRAADGEIQSKHRPWAIKLAPFSVQNQGADTYVSEANYARYGAVIKAVEAVPLEKLAYYIQQWQPLFEEAYQELGSAGDFQQRLAMALDQVAAADPRGTKAKLTRPSVMYKYADVRLEAASDIQKLLWRIGEANALRLQAVARELQDYLQTPPAYRAEF